MLCSCLRSVRAVAPSVSKVLRSSAISPAGVPRSVTSSSRAAARQSISSTSSMRQPVLASQHFSGGQLQRGAGPKKLAHILSSASAVSPQLLLVADRKVAAQDRRLTFLTVEQVQGAGWTREPEAEEFVVPGAAAAGAAAGGTAAAAAGLPDQPCRLPIYMLGQDSSGGVKLAVDVSGLPAELLQQQQGVQLIELRQLMPVLPPFELAMAGHAVALSQWHQAHLFCSRCGAPSLPAEAGARRQCSANPAHRLYPRTDPVVIMLVESPDGSKALLGRSSKHRPGMLTCLAGFIDQGESIEEAVVREVMEESGVPVSRVDIVGSQPWPIGRGGSCELMIGCMARAAREDLNVDYNEMQEVRWISREEVMQAVRASGSRENPYYKAGGIGSSSAGDGASSGPGFFIPPPEAIAHHLIKAWCEHGGNWFGSSSSAGCGEGGAAGGAAAGGAAGPVSVSKEPVASSL